MPAVGTSIFTDPVAYRAAFRDAAIDLVVTHGGNFRARLTWANLPNLQLHHSQESRTRRIELVDPARGR